MRIIVVLLIVVAVIGFILFVKSRIVPKVFVKIADIPAIYEKLKATGHDSNFAAFAFIPFGQTSASDAINIQFSIEEERIGVDWVLIGKSNIRDRDKFAQFAKSLGYTVSEREMNNVQYLRIEDGDLPTLCQGAISDLYSMPQETTLLLIPQGFAWP